MRRAAITFVTLLLLFVMFANVRQVWAFTITPSSPFAGQAFIISGDCTSRICIVTVFTDCTLVVELFSSVALSAGPYSVIVPGLPAGSYCAYIYPQFFFTAVSFSVLGPLMPSGYVPVYAAEAFLAHRSYCSSSPTHC